MSFKVTKAYVDYEKEEKWINEMAQKGYNLTGYTFIRYTFEEGIPGEYIYRTELLKELPSHPESKAYIKFMEDSGVECVSTYFRWAFFRKKASEGPFDIYSDIDSKITHYKRIIALLGTLGGANVIIGFTNFINWLGLGHPRGIEVSLYACLLSFFVGAWMLRYAFLYFVRMRNIKKEHQLYQ